ncbi:MAG: response regulator [Ignavibacteria bacterium]|nr:response regulator [Ignavibacteria bacterium]
MNQFKPLNILLIEDDNADATAFRRAMKKTYLDFKIEVCNEGESVLPMLKSQNFDFIFLDYQLPGSDGLSILQQIKLEFMHTPVVVITSQGDEKIAVDMMKNGAFDYFPKSYITSERLMQVLHTGLKLQSIEEEKNQATISLKENERLLDLVYNSTNVGMSLVDENGVILRVNNAYCHLFGYRKDDIIGNPFTDYILEEQRESAINKFKDFMAKGNENTYEHSIMNDENEPINLFVTEKIFSDEHGNKFMIATFTDITLKKQDEEHKRLIESVILNSNEAISLMKVTNNETQELQTIFINDAFTKLTGYESFEILGQKYAVLFGERTDKIELNKLYDSIYLKQKAEVEIICYTKNHSEYWVNLNISPIPDDTGRITHWVFIQRDITEKKKIEESLKRSKLEAETAARQRADFLSNMSHEIRTPMNAIIGLTELMLQETKDEKFLENLQSVKFSADNLLVIINEILDYSKLDAGKVKVENISFDIKQIFRELDKSIGLKAREKNIEFTSVVDENCPQFLIGDPVRINQILINLAGNAIKFTHKGKVEVKAEIVTKSNDEVKLLFAVTDTGIGIPDDKLHLIFESFMQAYTDTQRLFGGTGLGLTISKKLIEMLNGEIRVESTVNKGSKFYFELTLKIDKKERKDVPTESSKEARDLLGIKILIAEDNRMNQLVAKQIFKKWNVELQIANTGLEAVQLLSEKHYDVVLMDLQMPEMNGYEATEYIRDTSSPVLDHNVPIIALTADAFGETKGKVLDIGMNDFLMKPFKQEELYEKITKYLK